MAKGLYIGVNSVARKVNKIYIGVDGVARRIKKGYIGVGGAARLFFTAELSYVGTLTPLDKKKGWHLAGSNARYAVFMGGNSNASNTPSACAYDSNLTFVSAPSVSGTNREACAGNIGNYVWYSEILDSTKTSYITSYDLSLVRIISDKGIRYGSITEAFAINTPYYSYINIGNSGDTTFKVRTISASLVNALAPAITATPTQTGRRSVMMGTDGDKYIVCGGGTGIGSLGNSINFIQRAVAWNAETMTAYGQISDLVVARAGGIGFGNSKMSILAGGSVFDGYDSSVSSNVVDAYDINLVHYSNTLPFSGGGYNMSGIPSPAVNTPDKGYLFYEDNYVSFDTNLVRGTFPPSSLTRRIGAATTFQGDKIIYAGGVRTVPTPTVYYDNVDLYSY